MNVIYAKEKIPARDSSIRYIFFKLFKRPTIRYIFLAGPTPRSQDVPSWRPEALALLEAAGYGAFRDTVLVPEPRDGIWHGEYDDQVEWEEQGLEIADCILFWVPRNLDTMPGFTTNIEWGEWKGSGKVVLGFPPEVVKMTHMKRFAEKVGVPLADTLEGTIAAALKLMGQ